MKKTLSWLLAGAAVTLAAGAAIAQDATGEAARAEARRDAGMDARGDHHVHVYRGGDDRRREPRKAVMVHRSDEGREQRLKDALQLRPNQEPALKAFLEATRPEPGRHRAVRFDKDAPRKPASERLAEMEAKADERHAAMKKRIAATRTFYAQLDERQKKAFDAMPMLMMTGPGFGPAMIPIGHRMPLPPMPPLPPEPPPPPVPPGDI